MSEKDIIQNMISELGQSQGERMPRELGAHHADVDERTPDDILLFAKKFARLVHYYGGGTQAPSGNWEPFFPYAAANTSDLLADSSGNTPAHLALWVTFVKLRELPREAMNRITGSHLDFFYQRVLGFEKQASVADRAHVLLQLKKNTEPVLITPEHQFTGGKDDTGVELIYAPVRETVINASKVDSLCSIFVDQRGHGTVRFAPIANSVDGVGGELPEDNPQWAAFGHERLPAGEVGFAIASPVLRMAEGHRKVTLSLHLANVDPQKLKSELVATAFEAFITGAKSWIGPFGIQVTLTGNVLRLAFEVPSDEQAVVDYNASVHGYAYAATAPIVQVLLKAERTSLGYGDVKDVLLTSAQVAVEVTGVSSLVLESDAGALNPKKAFPPFGPQPAVGSRFMIGYAEALSKKLSEVKIEFEWQGLPSNLSTHYANYGVSGMGNAYFTASVSFQDGGSWVHKSTGEKLFTPLDTNSGARVLKLTPASSSTSHRLEMGQKVHALNTAGHAWARQAAVEYVRKNPVFKSFLTKIPDTPSGFITLSLEKDFKHTLYRTKTIEHALKYGKGDETTLIVLNEPYTPVIRSISLSYKAHSDDVSIESTVLDDFSNSDIYFFHIGCFGQMREHGYQRQQFDFVVNKRVPLLPSHPDEGELLVGLSNLSAGDSATLLFQIAEGSADPDLEQQPVKWYVLCDNYWKELAGDEVVLDTTNQLLASGVITFVIPLQATTENTILPTGFIWLKAAVNQHVRAVCQLIQVAANAVEVQFQDSGNDPAHLSAPLPEKKIAKLKTPIGAVKKIIQPYASFGGSPAETDEALHLRGSERLRHKNRCITVWDYERMVLGAFPSVQQVKCIPHAKDGSWLAPGHVLLVVVPDLRNKNALNPLQPKVDADTISRITAYLQAHAGMQVMIHVKNPRYQKIQADFKVKFHTGYEFNYYSEVVKQELIRFLSPWAFKAQRSISFGGRVYKSVLLDFVEELDCVDYVTDFKMYSYVGDHNTFEDVNEVQAETPDTLLVSDSTHSVRDAKS